MPKATEAMDVTVTTGQKLRPVYQVNVEYAEVVLNPADAMHEDDAEPDAVDGNGVCVWVIRDEDHNIVAVEVWG